MLDPIWRSPDRFEESERNLSPHAPQQQRVALGNHEVGSHDGDAPPNPDAESLDKRLMIRVCAVSQGIPGAGIDEYRSHFEPPPDSPLRSDDHEWISASARTSS